MLAESFLLRWWRTVDDSLSTGARADDKCTPVREPVVATTFISFHLCPSIHLQSHCDMEEHFILRLPQDVARQLDDMLAASQSSGADVSHGIELEFDRKAAIAS